MITKKIEDMYECPFKNKTVFQYSEYSSGVDETCNLMDGDECLKAKCPLIKEGSIVIEWTGA